MLNVQLKKELYPCAILRPL